VLTAPFNREVVVAIYRNVSGEPRASFTNVLDARLVALLQENLQPIQQELSIYQRTSDKKYGVLLSKIREQNLSINLAVEAIKLHITSATQALEKEPSSPSTMPLCRRKRTASSTDEESNALSQSLELMKISSTTPIFRESLQEMWVAI
jgi:hypothetical protein